MILSEHFSSDYIYHVSKKKKNQSKGELMLIRSDKFLSYINNSGTLNYL